MSDSAIGEATPLRNELPKRSLQASDNPVDGIPRTCKLQVVHVDGIIRNQITGKDPCVIAASQEDPAGVS